jgi:hypothetical protein
VRPPGNTGPVASAGKRHGGASLAREIVAGALDDRLDELMAAIDTRLAELARLRSEHVLARLRPGTRVVIGAVAEPKYLRGQAGEVHEIDGDVVVVCLDAPVGRFTSGHVRCPAWLIEPVQT